MASPTKPPIDTPQPKSGVSAGLLFWLALLLLVMGGTILTLAMRARGTGSLAGHQAEIDTAYLTSPDLQGVDWLKEFTLVERSGRKFASQELAGKPYLGSFFYSMCPSECIQQNTKLGELAREYSDSDFRFLSISCDPEVDHPERMREYAAKFRAHPDAWLFLTGNLLYIRRIGAEMYQVPVDVRSHTERFIAVDRSGKVRGHFNWKDPAQLTALRKLMKTMLAEEAAPPPGDAPKNPAAEQPAATSPTDAAATPAKGE